MPTTGRLLYKMYCCFSSLCLAIFCAGIATSLQRSSLNSKTMKFSIVSRRNATGHWVAQVRTVQIYIKTAWNLHFLVTMILLMHFSHSFWEKEYFITVSRDYLFCNCLCLTTHVLLGNFCCFYLQTVSYSRTSKATDSLSTEIWCSICCYCFVHLDIAL